MLSYTEKAKKSMIWANNGRKGETVDTERQKKSCLLPVPRAFAANGQQLKIELVVSCKGVSYKLILRDFLVAF